MKHIEFSLFSLWMALTLCPAQAAAEVFRQAVVVERPQDMPRRAAEIAVDGLAKEALLEAVITAKFSPVLLQQRPDDIRMALEPVEVLLENFSVVAREDLGRLRVRVTCEADIDLAAVLLRMVSAKVLTFADTPPRILLLPTARTGAAAVQAIRGRLGDTLGSAGFVLLAAEATAAATVTKAKISANEIAVMMRNVAETRADLIALIDLVGSPAPSPVGGSVVDAVLQYTVVRPRDNAIVAEQVFSSRGGGATPLLAEQAVLAELGPEMGRSLAGRLAQAIFESGDVVDGSGALDGSVTINVFFRPSASATSSMIDLLRAKGANVSLGTNAMASLEAEIRNRVGDVGFASKKLTPADRLLVSGKVSTGWLFDLFSRERFGPAGAFRTSVIEYGDSYMGVEILEVATVPKAPAVAVPPTTAPPAAATNNPETDHRSIQSGAQPLGRSAVSSSGASKAPLVYRRRIGG